MYKEYSTLEIRKRPRQLLDPLFSSYVVGYFYGVARKRTYRNGIFLKINEDNYFKLWMNYGLGTNTKVELISLWCLLKFGSTLGIATLQVLEDSMIILKGENK